MFSIITPMDTNRLEQFKETKRAYDAMPQKKEFVIPTRSHDEVANYLSEHDLTKDVRLIPYEIENGFNVSKALNLGVKNAKYNSIIITSPEVKPVTNVLEQLSAHIGENVLCWVDDEYEDGSLHPLVYKGFRDENPGMYFLAMFNKSDIQTINGWDEEFMRGYAYEDNDFGARWVRAGLPFKLVEEIKAVHQYHPRAESVPGGLNTNLKLFEQNNANGVIKPLNGLEKL